ncbi:cytochrome P450 9e2-like [Wyeomyia smithii]|uniref:cytochrome P450 9e2-like n=1 Tax=Wyeomyia smithii TaxID=174621 RepID=UPI002467ADEB|nr:cytochrome P450 9e2-like [Wyeomyia smithii]XP_055529197.1 cytochrome P450 9e2-like [Wyeomyia smithii]
MDINLTYLVALGAVLVGVYYFITRKKHYFHHKPIPSMRFKLPLGNTAPLYLRQGSFGGFVESIYNQFRGVKVFGMFDLNEPVFVLRDPALIKQVGVKDFDHFTDRVPVFGNTDHDHPNLIIGKSLFTLTGQKWKSMRSTLSPAFTGSKMRQMFNLVVECSENTAQHFLKRAQSGTTLEYEMRDVFSRFANDVIASCAFGIQVDSLQNKNNDFYLNGKKMVDFNRISVLFRFIGYRLMPGVMARLGIDAIDEEQNRYFSSLILSAIREREAKGIVRQDMINLLIQAKKGILKHQQEKEQHEGFAAVEESNVGKAQSLSSLTDTELVAQCMVFFLAGFDTVSTCLLFTTYELTLNPQIQNKLYAEVMQTYLSLEGKSLTYDAMQKMKYMDMVVSEALRMWPPVPQLDRICLKDYTLDCNDNLKFTIEKGSIIWLPVQGLHRDPAYYPNPDKFDPERFSEERKGSINAGAYLPFGIGPRNCIGSRLALAEVKTILYYMLLNFSFEQTSKTKVPLVITKGDIIPEGGVHLEFRPRG